MRALVLAVAVMVSGSAWAEETFPIIDVEKNCSSPGGIKVMRQSYNICIDREQEYYNLAKRAFPDLDESVKSICRENAEKFTPSYYGLYGCYYARQTAIDDTRQRERENKEPARKFRY